MTTTRVTDWPELLEVLFDDTWNPTINRYRSTFAYRGLNIERYPLTTKLARLGTPYPNMERNLIKQFKKYARPQAMARDGEWHWLSIAQHHGLPTRLLDWTYSPLVALHFATSNLDDFHEDAAVWKVNYAEAHSLLQGAQQQSLHKLGAQIFSVDALEETIKDLQALDSMMATTFDVAVFFEPPALDERIVNQFAYFSVLSDPTLSMDDWLNRPTVAGVSATKIVIPATLKWQIRDRLDQSNVTERVLFPGHDGLCQWLTRHYKPT
jgi:hypothetical protein